MGLEFGHHLGLSGALKGLPLSPLIPGYQELVAQQQALGLRHVGEALVRHSGALRILDGVFVRRARNGWQHVDGNRLRQLRAEAPAEFVPLLLHLESVDGPDPSALRRVILYQLIELLQQHPQGSLPATAVSFGISPDEAAALAHAAGARHRHGPRQRAAAEELEDTWRRGRLRTAARLAAQLPADGAGDALLTRRLSHIASRVRLVDSTLDQARRLELGGETEAAAAAYLRAVRLANDCPGALRGLIRTHRPADAGPAAPMALLLATDRVRLSWPGSESAPDSARSADWRVIRVTRKPGLRPVLDEIRSRPQDEVWADTAPPLGHEVRYAVLPLRDDRIDGPPFVSGTLLVVPDVSGFRPVDGNGRIDAGWVRPPGALGVRAELTGPDGRIREIAARDDGFTADGLPTGRHSVRIRCRYRGADGTEVLSPGINGHLTVHPWPSPVLGLSATGFDGCAQFTWTGGENAEVRLVSWPDEPPAPGTELHRPAAQWPSPLPWEPSADGLVPPPGTLTRVSALAILGERAIAGPSIRVEAPHQVGSPTAERTARGLVRITFDWPPDTGEVVVLLQQDGESVEHRVTRSVFLREGLYVPVSPSRLRLVVTAASTARTADTTFVAPVTSETELPADVRITYRIVPGPRRPLRRRPASVHVTLVTAGGEVPLDIPEFVLVARTGEGRNPVRPRHHGDGTTVIRLTGDELRRAGTVERELTAGVCRPPYALRAFLLGGPTAAVRLDEPSPATLVVR